MPRDTGVILVVTHARDDHVEPVLRELAARGLRAVRFDTDSPDASCELRVGHHDPVTVSVTIRTPTQQFEGSAVGSIWWRHLRIPNDDRVTAEARALVASERRAAMEGALLTLEAFWLNHPNANRRARSKPLQLALAVREGLRVPPSAVLRDPSEVRRMFRVWDGEMIAKLVGGQLAAARAEEQYAIHTSRVTERDLAADDAIAAAPALYQRAVPKAYELRATLVGDRFFTCRIDFPHGSRAAQDWRATPERVRLSRAELDPEVARRCLALARSLDLGFAAFDLVVTPAGDTVFLELNANGRWRWVEERTGLPIAAAVARRLAQA